MREIDLGSPSLGLEDDDAVEMATRPQRNLWSRGINPGAMTPFDAKALADTLAELDGMNDDELDELADEGSDTGDWLDTLNDDRFRDVMDEAQLHGNDGVDYLDFSRNIDSTLAAMTGRENIRQAEDANDRARRGGPRHNRPSAEEVLQRGLSRYSAGTFVYGQADLSNAMFDENDFAASTATAVEVEAELRYQLTGQGVPLARQHRQALPHMSAQRLTQLGLKP